MKEKPTTGWLTLVCLQTGKEINTGVVYTQDDLERAKPAKLLERCRHCRKSHMFKFANARLKPTRQLIPALPSAIYDRARLGR